MNTTHTHKTPKQYTMQNNPVKRTVWLSVTALYCSTYNPLRQVTVCRYTTLLLFKLGYPGQLSLALPPRSFQNHC